MEKMEVYHDSDKKTLALVMFIAGILVWFLVDSAKPLAHDLVKAIGFFLFVYGTISLSTWKPWAQLSSKEMKMRIIFFIIITVLIIAAVLLFLLRK
jgi:uncharacterized membrane protein